MTRWCQQSASRHDRHVNTGTNNLPHVMTHTSSLFVTILSTWVTFSATLFQTFLVTWVTFSVICVRFTPLLWHVLPLWDVLTTSVACSTTLGRSYHFCGMFYHFGTFLPLLWHVLPLWDVLTTYVACSTIWRRSLHFCGMFYHFGTFSQLL